MVCAPLIMSAAWLISTKLLGGTAGVQAPRQKPRQCVTSLLIAKSINIPSQPSCIVGAGPFEIMGFRFVACLLLKMH